MEKLFDTANLIDDKIVKAMVKPLSKVEVKNIIDAGSGKTSASMALKYFPEATVDAIIFPGDNRKINPITSAIGSDRLNVIEANICTAKFKKQYDFCLVHLTLGETHNFGNHFSDILHKILDINSKYFLIVDVWEDTSVNFRYMEKYIQEKGFKLIKRKKFINPNPEHYPKVEFDKYKLEYDSKHYIAYLIKKL